MAISLRSQIATSNELATIPDQTRLHTKLIITGEPDGSCQYWRLVGYHCWFRFIEVLQGKSTGAMRPLFRLSK